MLRDNLKNMYIYVEDTYALVSQNVFTVECIEDIPGVVELIYTTSIKEDRDMLGLRFVGTGFGRNVGWFSLFGAHKFSLFTVCVAS